MVCRLIFSLSIRMVSPRPKYDVNRREIAKALVIAGVVVVLDKGRDLTFQITR